ncbi:MAG: TOBE domain-containing protein, partial [Acidobacteria bacterium]|nr:TOBE domain-containing protein [Acidobacteriota bacterium]
GTPPMNLLPGLLADQGASVATAGFSVRLPPGLAAAARAAGPSHDGSKVVLGIRPENVHDPERAAGDGGALQPLTGRVEFVEPLGHEVIVHARVGADLLLAKVGPHRAPRMGDELTLAVETAAIHLFDAAGEQRIAPAA